MPTVVETQHVHEESDSSATVTSIWTPPDGYKFSTFTQRRADAARDTQDEADDLLTAGDWEDAGAPTPTALSESAQALRKLTQTIVLVAARFR